MKNTSPLETVTRDDRSAYDSPTLTQIGDATEVVMGVPNLDGSDYFGFARSEFEFEPDGDDAESV